MQKMYVLVRKDLPKKYQAVQAGHAVAEYLLRQPFLSWDNGTLIYLGVEDEVELIEWGEKIKSIGKEYVGFIEPDIGYELTALAVVDNGYIFRGLKLL